MRASPRTARERSPRVLAPGRPRALAGGTSLPAAGAPVRVRAAVGSAEATGGTAAVETGLAARSTGAGRGAPASAPRAAARCADGAHTAPKTPERIAPFRARLRWWGRIGCAVASATLLVVPAGAALAETLTIDLGQGSVSAQIVRLFLLITALALAPSLLVMVTAFTRIVVALSLLRSALGLQSSPPNMVLVGLALFATFFVMQPQFEQAWREGIAPLLEEEIGPEEALARASAPFRAFMLAQARDEDLALFFDVAGIDPPAAREETPWRVLVPAFVVGELRRAFEIGFLLYLPFVVIDLVVASLLMGMGMMMLPPVMVAMPFKLIFFVLVDGWRLVLGGLVAGFAPVG
ncbi:Flagellar biosynthetic protein FliP [bacterium HR39]|nr:Flagellar biosynthetic protein FliP [bacterium HR39]